MIKEFYGEKGSVGKKTSSGSTLASSMELLYFQEIAQTLNFSRASERLGVSQPTLSQAMGRLESSVGEALFVRHKRGVTLTPAGRHLLVHVHALLDSWNQVAAKARSSVNDIGGQFSIGCHVSVALYSLPNFVRDVFTESSIELRLQHDLSRHITEQVISSELDLGIVVNPVKHRDLIIQRVATDEVAFWTAKGAKSKLTSCDGEGILIADGNLLQAQSLMRKCEKQGLKFRFVLTSSSLEVVASLAAAGTGVAILPTRVAQLARHELVRVPNSPIFVDEVCVIVRSENRKVASIQYLIKKIKQGMTSSH